MADYEAPSILELGSVPDFTQGRYDSGFGNGHDNGNAHGNGNGNGNAYGHGNGPSS